MRKIFCSLILIMFVVGPIIGQTGGGPGDITLEKLWVRYEYLPAFPQEFRWMNDDQYYSVLEEQSIWRYGIENEKKIDALLDLNQLSLKGGVSAAEIRSYEFSEDEKKILLPAQTESIYRLSSKSVYQVVDRTSGAISLLHEGKKVSNPVVSPDGKHVAYTFENNIYRQELATDQITPVTRDGKKNAIINGMTDWVYEEEFIFTRAFFWSPEGDKIAYLRFDESEVLEFVMPVFGELYPHPETWKYPKAGEKNSVVSAHVYELTSGNTIMADMGEATDFYLPRMRWRTNDEVAVQQLSRLQNHLELVLIDAGTGKTRSLLTESSESYIEVSDLTWRMEKWHFLEQDDDFLWVSEKEGFYHIYRYDGEGNLVKDLTPGEYEAMNIVAVDEHSNRLYYTSTEDSPLERHLYSVSLDGKKKKKLTKEPGVHSVTVSSAGNYFVDSYSNHNSPEKTVLANSSGKVVKVVEANEGLSQKAASLTLGETDFFDFTTTDGAQLNGWMIKPPNFDPSKQYPVMMFCYGGPGDQQVLNSWGFGDPFNYFWHQMLAQNGYIVACVDNRGTGARGTDFRTITYPNLGHYETIDQIAAGKYLGSLPYADASRVGIWGWSYGGYLTSLCMTKGKGTFKMGIAVAPVTNWRFYDTIYTERYLKTPQLNPDGYDKNSPLNFARDLQGKFLLVHGTGDDNVHFQNTVEMTDALIAANKDFDVMFYPNRNHGIFGGITRYHLYRKMTRFIFDNL